MINEHEIEPYKDTSSFDRENNKQSQLPLWRGAGGGGVLAGTRRQSAAGDGVPPSLQRFPDERTPIEATPLSATSSELGLGFGIGFTLTLLLARALLLLATLLSHTIPFPRVH